MEYASAVDKAKSAENGKKVPCLAKRNEFPMNTRVIFKLIFRMIKNNRDTNKGTRKMYGINRQNLGLLYLKRGTHYIINQIYF